MKKRILIKTGLIRIGTLIEMGALVGIGVLTNKNTFEEGRFERGCLLEGGS